MSQEVRKNPEKTLKKPSPTCHDALVASGLMYKRKIDAILAAGRESRASEPQKNPKIDVNTYSKKGQRASKSEKNHHIDTNST